MKNKIVAVVGPTASGKTALSVEIAKKYGGEIVSCDSMQIYKYMNIGTAKPTLEERQGIPHFMIDILEPSESYSVVNFAVDAKKCIEDILRREKLPVLVGGTGLYIDSVINNVNFSEGDKDEKYRLSLEQLAKEKGNEYVHRMLEKVDFEAAQSIHSNNLRRVIRALEVYKMTGKTFTQAKKESVREPEYDALMLGINMDRDLLYERINKRVDDMIDQGLLDEVKKILSMNMGKGFTAMQAIGYKEFSDYLSGKISILEATERLKMESRRYAKRQLTWFKRNEKINWFIYNEASGVDALYRKCFELLDKKLY